MNNTGERAPRSLPIVPGGSGEVIGLPQCSQDSASAVGCPAYLRDLNIGQRKAVEYAVSENTKMSGPLLIIAGAGTGKTNTLAHRVAHLIMVGTLPERILLLTFTRRAASEMTTRAQRILTAARATSGASPH